MKRVAIQPTFESADLRGGSARRLGRTRLPNGPERKSKIRRRGDAKMRQEFFVGEYRVSSVRMSPAGHSISKRHGPRWRDNTTCHGRIYSAHPRLQRCNTAKTWMPGIKPGMTNGEARRLHVMAGLVPAIHVFLSCNGVKSWMEESQYNLRVGALLQLKNPR